MTSELNTKKLAMFLGLTFAISWTSGVGLYLSGIELGTLLGTILITATFMWAPAFSAILTKFWYGESILDSYGLKNPQFSWTMLAWVVPVLILVLTVGIALLFPEVILSPDYEPATLEALPASIIPIVFVVQGLFAGITINAVAALGEELGWRGLLLDELSSLGFWKVSIITGLIWGIWHAPIIAQGHNFPGAPLIGIIVMIGATVAISPVYTYFTVRANSVWAATLLHGSFNGIGSLSLIFVMGASNIFIAPVGIAGIGAALVVVLVCLFHDRVLADERIMDKGSLSPFEKVE